MSSNDLLDGKAGAEAQANEILRILNAEMEEAIRGIQLEAGNAITQAGGLAVARKEDA
jgi:hypothetical protein